MESGFASLHYTSYTSTLLYCTFTRKTSVPHVPGQNVTSPAPWIQNRTHLGVQEQMMTVPNKDLVVSGDFVPVVIGWVTPLETDNEQCMFSWLYNTLV